MTLLSRRAATAFFFLSAVFLATAPALRADESDLDKQAKAAWGQREDISQTKKAIELWTKSYQQNPSETSTLIWLTRACNRAFRNDDSHRKDWAQKALQFGEEAINKNPSSAEAHAYYAEALGQYAQAHKGYSSLKRVKVALAELKRAVEIDEHYAYAHMLMSQFYREAPSSISIGDKSKALSEAQLAVRDGPGVPINHLTLAKAYLALNRKDEAERELKNVLSLSAPPDNIPETKSDQNSARELLKKMGASTALLETHSIKLASSDSYDGRTAGSCSENNSNASGSCTDAGQCSGACVESTTTVPNPPSSTPCAGWTNHPGTCDNSGVTSNAP